MNIKMNICTSLLQVLCFCGLVFAHHEKCEEILWKSPDTKNGTNTVFTGDSGRILQLLPLTVTFNKSVKISETEFLDIQQIGPEKWILSHLATKSEKSPPKQLSLVVSSKFKSIEISKIKLKDGVELECTDHDSLFRGCGFGGKLDLSPDKILIRHAAWSTGRNYEVEIPSYPTFVGYSVDLFFDGPVTAIQVPPGRVKAVEISPTHWILAGDYTDSACVKLIDIFFTISYVEMRDIVGILLNGNPVFGTGKSAAVLQNKNFDAAMNTDCEKFFTRRDNPWYNPQGEKARSLWFNAFIPSPRQIGLVVDFILEQNIEEIRVWELKAEELEEHHWRVTNPGIIVSPNETIRFPLNIYFHHDYHVKIIGIKVNDNVICGLGSKASVIVEEKDIPESRKIIGQSMQLETLYSYILVSVILIAVAILFSVVMFALILIRKMKETLRKRRHLYDFPAKQPSMNARDNNYASINDSVATVDNCVSQM